MRCLRPASAQLAAGHSRHRGAIGGAIARPRADRRLTASAEIRRQRDGAPCAPRHWRSYGDDPLPTGAEALNEPFRAFPSWLMRVTCDRCGKDRMFSETHAAEGGMLIRDILKRMRHDGCGGRPVRAELLTGIDGASSRPVRRIVLLDG
jgi:hypothetical protein